MPSAGTRDARCAFADGGAFRLPPCSFRRSRYAYDATRHAMLLAICAVFIISATAPPPLAGCRFQQPLLFAAICCAATAESEMRAPF